MYIKSGVLEESEILKSITKFFITNNIDLEIDQKDTDHKLYGKYSSLRIASSSPKEDVFKYICFVLKLNPIKLPYSVLAGIDKNLILTYSSNCINVYATKNYSKTFQVIKIERLLKE